MKADEIWSREPLAAEPWQAEDFDQPQAIKEVIDLEKHDSLLELPSL